MLTKWKDRRKPAEDQYYLCVEEVGEAQLPKKVCIWIDYGSVSEGDDSASYPVKVTDFSRTKYQVQVAYLLGSFSRAIICEDTPESS